MFLNIFTLQISSACSSNPQCPSDMMSRIFASKCHQNPKIKTCQLFIDCFQNESDIEKQPIL